MAWYLWTYLALLAAIPLYEVVGSLFDEEPPELSEYLTYAMYTPVLLCFAAYAQPEVAGALGGWLWVAIVVAGLTVAILGFGTWGAVIGRESASDDPLVEADDPPAETATDDGDPLPGMVIDLDRGNPPKTPEEQAAIGKAVMSLFSPVASTGERLEGLAALDQAMPDEDDAPSRSDNVLMFAFAVVSAPAVALGALAALA